MMFGTAWSSLGTIYETGLFRSQLQLCSSELKRQQSYLDALRADIQQKISDCKRHCSSTSLNNDSPTTVRYREDPNAASCNNISIGLDAYPAKPPRTIQFLNSAGIRPFELMRAARRSPYNGRKTCSFRSALSRSQPSLLSPIARRPPATPAAAAANAQINDAAMLNKADPTPMLANGRVSSTSSTASTETVNSNNFLAAFPDNNDSEQIGNISLHSLIKKMMPHKDYTPQKCFIFTIILNSRIFLPPSEILRQILQFCIFEQNQSTDNFKKSSAVKFFCSVLRLTREWTEEFPWDFICVRALRRLDDLLLLCSTVDVCLKKHCETLRFNLKQRLAKLERYEVAIANIRNQLHSGEVACSDQLTGLVCVCNNSSTVAEQLSHIELEKMSMIGPEEFVYSLAREHSKVDISQVNSSQTKNLQHCADWFNRLSFLVATDICRNLKRKHRVQLIQFYIDVAKECFNIGNFNSLMSIVAGLNLCAVARLKKTWERVDKNKLEILELQLNPSGNFGSYRATLKAAQWRSNSGRMQEEKIVIPFLSLFLKDQLLLFKDCTTKSADNEIDFRKWARFAEKISEFVKWKQVEVILQNGILPNQSSVFKCRNLELKSCPFERCPPVLQYLLTSAQFSEYSLMMSSFKCEAPENLQDKEQHRKLKKCDADWKR